jgi:hypothetical protein
MREKVLDIQSRALHAILPKVIGRTLDYFENGLHSVERGCSVDHETPQLRTFLRLEFGVKPPAASVAGGKAPAAIGPAAGAKR